MSLTQKPLDFASIFQETFEKLNNEVKLLGMILGVKSENNQQVVPPTTAEEPAQGEDKNQYHVSVS